MTSPSSEQLDEQQARQVQVQKESQLRSALQQGFGKIYGELIQFLNNLDLHPTFKSHCYLNFDQGAYWAREAINMVQFGNKETPKPLEVVADVTPEQLQELANKAEVV